MPIQLVDNGKTLRVGYVLKRFPRLSETFILNELLELDRQGVAVEVFSLLHPPSEARHALLAKLRAPVTYLPRGYAVKALRVQTESEEEHSVEDLLADLRLPFDTLFSGKTARDVCHLTLQASALALLASARGLTHLHAHFASNATAVAMLASRLTGIPYSFTAHARDIYHTYVNESVDDAVRRRKISEARFVVTVSEYNRRHLTRLAGTNQEAKVRRLYNGIDLSRFRPDDAMREPKLLLAVGRLVEKKGFKDLVEACGVMRDSGTAFKCLIVGDGPERARLARRISELQLGDYVMLSAPQPQEELLNTMRRASAVVLPCVVSESGDRDGLPTVLLEALAMGLPAISTTVSGIPEIIDHEQNGLLVPPGDPQTLAAAMQRLLADRTLAADLGANGRVKAESAFDLRRNVATLRSYFADTLTDAVTEPEERSIDEHRLHHRG